MTRLFVVAALAAAATRPAAAQVTGTYSGISADGQNLMFVVSTNPANGGPEVTAAQISFAAPCKGSSFILNTTWGIGLASDVVGGKVKISTYDNYFTFAINLAFAADGQTATGTIQSIGTTLYKAGPHPKSALICTSPTQNLSLTLQPVGAATSQAKPDHVSPHPALAADEPTSE